MEQTLVTWKMSSASPGAVPVRASDRQQFEYRIDSGRGRARIEPMCSVVTGDGRCENVQLAADENEEWAKIENIMASLDAGLNDRDEGLNGLTVQCHGRKLLNSAAVAAPSSRVGAEVHSVRQWLDSFGLAHLEDVLLTNGFDDIDFLGPSVLSDSDLVEIGVNNAVSRHRLLSAACKLPPFSSHAPTRFDSLAAWLTALRLSEYIETFQLHGFTSIERLHNLWDVELTSVLHISRLGHRNRIMAAISLLPAPSPLNKGSECRLEPEIELASNQDKQSLNDISLFKDYTTLLRTRSKTSQSLTAGSDKQPQQKQLSVEENHERLRIRPPQTGGSEIKEWSHRPEVLMNGSCVYKVMYVGHGVVDCFNNTSATHEAIVAIRQHCAKTLRGATSILMRISHTGVELVKFATKEVLGSYSIANIFCVSQDVEHLDYFAFVTFQPSANVHYCHVFFAETVQLAVEVVLTLGQAFEVAYQLAVRQNGSTVGEATQFQQTAGTAQTDNKLADKNRSPIAANNHRLKLKL